jgi:curved DNA-binding protein CbpA
MAAENYYEVLGLKKGVSDEEVKQAFREHAKVLHPDRNPDDPDAERRFKLVNTAYEALKDAARRRAYDEWLAFARRHERSRLAQWGRLAALIAVLLLGPSVALYQAYILLENWDKPSRPVASVNASDTAKSGDATKSGERLGATPPRQPAAPAVTPPPAPQAAEPVRTPPESKPAAAARPDVTAALPRREETAPAPRPDAAPAARPVESTQPKSETPPSPVPAPRTAEPARPATSPDAAPAAPDSRTTRRPLREVVGADEEAPPQQTPRPLAPAREPPTERSPAPAPADPPAVAQEGAARGMARILAELKEPGGVLGPPLPVPPDSAPAPREQNQTRLAPDEESSEQRGSDVDDFSDCPRCPVMSVVKATDLVPRAERGPSGRSLAISKFEVTVAEWNACAQEGACQGVRSHPGGANRPVVDVSRAEAAEYAEWLSRKTGRPYRLMKVGGWAPSPSERGEDTRSARAVPRSAQECGGPEWRWLDDEECLRRFRQSERAARGQQPYQSSSGFRVARSLGPDG